MNYALRQAQDSDLDFLIHLRKLTMTKYLKQVGMPVTQEAYLSRVLYEFEHAKIVTVDGQNAGLFKAKFDEQSHEWYLAQIQIHPDYQNRQIANGLISDLIDKAHASGVGVSLNVLKTNPAKRLYERLGFVAVSENQFEFHMKCQCPATAQDEPSID
ncbi:GNAT family N-acetyltransferase [Celerinatantimonas sp. MCCC 1A17872]|uniref:GNAT family N-acetyltransferase n=1 Tax=Celerinatantimonas sp. MCCC 1A17872 TaxID=3177514 RepID=UPI0038C6BCD6